MEIQQPVLTHLPQFKRQAAPLNRKVICKLLAGIWNIKFEIPTLLGCCRQIGQQFCSGCPLPQMGQFFILPQVFYRQVGKQILYHFIVMGTTGWTSMQDLLDIQE